MTSSHILVVAAGEGRRLGGAAKALLRPPSDPAGPTLLERIANVARRLELPLSVVVGGRYADAVRTHALGLHINVVNNPSSVCEMADSVAVCGHAMPATNDVLLLWPVDTAGVTIETVRQVIAHSAATRVVVPTWQGRGGHPTSFGRMYFAALGACATAADGARAVVRSAGESCVRIPVDDAAIRHDIDYYSDWQ